ncbi:MAG TPA: hypothetical protein VHD90_01310 [Phototrophicaceae bacterium]|nr:hypothetical protein [Phototrophicaceae bacterium]
MAGVKFQLVHPEGKSAPRIDQWKYDTVRSVLLAIIPADEQGIPFAGLDQRVTAALAPDQVTRIGSIGWYMTHVKLDLEARGEIERVPGSSPQRLRRTS